MKKLTPNQQKNKQLKETKKRQAAVRVVKQILVAYKEFHRYIIEKKKNAPMKGIATKALHTILGTKIKQKAKECNHCHIKTNNGKSLCADCVKIPMCKYCQIMMGYWNEDKTQLLYSGDWSTPSLLDPTLCIGCYELKHKDD